MTTPTQTSSARIGGHRFGFTLVEILVVIAIIGILIAALSAAVIPALKRAQEAAVQTEMKQIELELENFKTQFGFYPPSFEQFQRTDVFTDPNPSMATVQAEANQLLPYLNKISPNHREAGPSAVPGRATNGWRRIDDWWLAVGRNLGQSNIVPFWLSGLCASKQYPLTGGLLPPSGSTDPLEYIPAGFGVNRFANGNNIVDASGNALTLPRNNFFDFKPGQLVAADGNGNFFGYARYTGGRGADEINPDGTITQQTMQYRDAPSYIPYNVKITAAPMTTANATIPGIAYHVDSNVSATWQDGSKSFANPNSFQICTTGMDAKLGIPSNPLDSGNLLLQGAGSEDNLCNFSDGRLSSFETDSLGL